MRAGALERRPWLVPAIVFAVAWVWRVAYLARLSRTPLFGDLILDSQLYWDWASALRAHGPWGRHPFFMGPLYPYSLAGLRAVVGDSVSHVLAAQAVWGAAACALLADAARRLTRPALGLAAGLWIALYEMAVFFDGLVLMESLLFFFEAFLLWWVVRMHPEHPRLRDLAVVGIAIGLAAAARASSALLLVPAALFLVPGRPARLAPAATRAGSLLLGFALVSLPIAARNYVLGGEWIPFSYNGGLNLYIGNSPEATGGFVLVTDTNATGDRDLAGDASMFDGREYLRKVHGLVLTPLQSSDWWAAQAGAYVRSHPARAIRLGLAKLGMLWNRREVPQIESVDEFRSLAGPVGLARVGTFGVLGPLAVAGLFFAWRRGPRGRFLVGSAAAMTLAILPFFVTDRYRHHLIPAAMLLAAVALEETWTALARGGGRRLVPPGLALALGLVVVNLPVPHLSAGKLAWGVASDLGTRYLKQGRTDLAVQQFERALAIEREVGRTMAGGATGAFERAGLYGNYATALSRLGRDAEALPWYERAASEAPDQTEILDGLASAYVRAGRVEEAESLYAHMRTRAFGEGRALAGEGWVAAREGRLDRAEALFGRAVEIDPHLFDAWGALVRLRIEAGRIAEARATLESARAADLPPPAFAAHEALLCALEGRRAEAESALSRVPAGALEGDPRLAEVAAKTRQILSSLR